MLNYPVKVQLKRFLLTYFYLLFTFTYLFMYRRIDSVIQYGELMYDGPDSTLDARGQEGWQVLIP